MLNRSANFQSRICFLFCSAAVSASTCFLLFVFFLQSFGVSVNRLIAGLVIFGVLVFIVYCWILFLLKHYFNSVPESLYRHVVFWAIISALLAPYILPVPYYPVSPLFRMTSEVLIQFSFPESDQEAVQLRGVWLVFDDKKISYDDFQLSDDWELRSGRYFIDTAINGSLSWKGKIGERAKLTIFPVDETAAITVIWDGKETSSILKDTPISFTKKAVTPFWFYGSIVLAQFVVVCFLLMAFFAVLDGISSRSQRTAIINLFIFTLSVLLVRIHFQSDDITRRFDLQIGYHEGIISGQAPSPWQYRVLSEWILSGLINLFSSLGYTESFYFGSFFIRVTQNILIYFTAYSYFRKFNGAETVSLIGVLFLSGSLLNSYYNTGFSLNTYFDVLFYLLAMLLVLKQTYTLLPLLMVLASLNRETSGLIPFLALVAMGDIRNQRNKVVLVALAFLCWAVVFVGLRLGYPPREMFVPYGKDPGIPLLVFNLFPPPFFFLLRFFGFVPILGLAVWSRLKLLQKRLFYVIVPVWVIIHLVASVISETRLFLVPQIIVFIPAFLVFVAAVKEKITVKQIGAA